MAGKRTPDEIQRILNQPNPLTLTGPIRVRLGVLGAIGVVASIFGAANLGKPPRVNSQGYVRTTRFERLPLPIQWACVICLFGIALGVLLVAIRDAVRRPTLSFDDEGMVNGHALTLKPVSIKWSDVVRIDEAQKKDKKKKAGIVIFYRKPGTNQQKKHVMSAVWGLKISQPDMYTIVMDRYRRWHERHVPANPGYPQQGTDFAAPFPGPGQQGAYPNGPFGGPRQQEAYAASSFPAKPQHGAYSATSFSEQPQGRGSAQGREQNNR